MPLLREDQRQPLQAMLDKALVQTPRPASTPSTVAEIDSNVATAAKDAKASEIKPATPQRRTTWGWLALLAAALALFVVGLIRSHYDAAARPVQLPEGAR
jgi:ferric-dicitrate binding protein FerR (iron transport regulator)